MTEKQIKKTKAIIAKANRGSSFPPLFIVLVGFKCLISERLNIAALTKNPIEG